MRDIILQLAFAGNVLSTTIYVSMEGVKATGRLWAIRAQRTAAVAFFLCTLIIVIGLIPAVTNALP